MDRFLISFYKMSPSYSKFVKKSKGSFRLDADYADYTLDWYNVEISIFLQNATVYRMLQYQTQLV